MTCYLFDPGSRVRCVQAFQVIERQMNGPDRTTTIERGDEGRVVDKSEPQHTLMVDWERLQRILPVRGDDIGKLVRIAGAASSGA